MKAFICAAASCLVFAISPAVFAQDDGEVEEEAVPKDELVIKDEMEPKEVPEEANPGEDTERAATVAVDKSVFPIRRGFFGRGDFGVFFAFGGADYRLQTDPNTGSNVADSSVSNLQPLVGVTLGYDVVAQNKFNLALGARFAATFNGSSARIPGADSTGQVPQDPQTYPADFEILQFGAAIDATFMTSERLGILVHGDGGISVVSPDPGTPATDPNQGIFVEGAGDAAIGGIFSGGAGVEYYTLLTGFSVGLTAAFYGVITSDDFIPGLGIYVPLKYNF